MRRPIGLLFCSRTWEERWRIQKENHAKNLISFRYNEGDFYFFNKVPFSVYKICSPYDYLQERSLCSKVTLYL